MPCGTAAALTRDGGCEDEDDDETEQDMSDAKISSTTKCCIVLGKERGNR